MCSESKDGISRALDNIGRCHARLGQFAQAIDSWMEKLPLSKTPLETTWLHHEIGRCYLEQKNYQNALECGQRSLKSAQEAQEKVWELNATVLIAQSQGESATCVLYHLNLSCKKSMRLKPDPR